MSELTSDCLIIGAGPAGLAAALYLARFRMSVQIVDGGRSRAAMIPCSRNYPGFPEGIAGAELLERMRRHTETYGVPLLRAEVTRLTLADGVFTAVAGATSLRATSVLLATGVTNRRPEMPSDLHDQAVAEGRLRYCPICDGYEVIGQDVAVLGTGEHGMKEAEFLRAYTDRVTLVAPDGTHRLDEAARRRLRERGIATADGPAEDFTLEDDTIRFRTPAGYRAFASVYPGMGSEIHSGLATGLGAQGSEEGCLKVDPHQRTSVAGLYAAGDVVLGLDQISHAIGEAGVAATAIRNDQGARPA